VNDLRQRDFHFHSQRQAARSNHVLPHSDSTIFYLRIRCADQDCIMYGGMDDYPVIGCEDTGPTQDFSTRRLHGKISRAIPGASEEVIVRPL
jgi:hypothetical protein